MKVQLYILAANILLKNSLKLQIMCSQSIVLFFNLAQSLLTNFLQR